MRYVGGDFIVTYSEISDVLNQIAPLSLAEDWDNSGFQILLDKKEIRTVLLCLDVTAAVIKEAINANADLIISHHPMYFNPFRNIVSGDLISDYTIELIKNGISVYSSHTSFDKAEKGTNFYLAKMLGLSDLHFFDEVYEKSIGIYGELPANESVSSFVANMYKTLDIDKHTVRIVGDTDAKILKVGICTGAGMSEFQISQKLNCDVFITGDLKYHEALCAFEKNKLLIDIGHFDSEKFFVENLAAQLRNIYGERLNIIQTKTMLNPFKTL